MGPAQLQISQTKKGRLFTGPDCGTHLGDLPAECIARHVRVPVHERTGGILLPGPHMQCVERRKSEAVGTLEEMKELTPSAGAEPSALHSRRPRGPDSGRR